MYRHRLVLNIDCTFSKKDIKLSCILTVATSNKKNIAVCCVLTVNLGRNRIFMSFILIMNVIRTPGTNLGLDA